MATPIELNSSSSLHCLLPSISTARSVPAPSMAVQLGRQHQRAASIPKFGAWDETDPQSGEGFTVIFDRVKEEKQIAPSTFPSVPTRPVNHQTSQRNHGKSSSPSKFCCCFFPRGE